MDYDFVQIVGTRLLYMKCYLYFGDERWSATIEVDGLSSVSEIVVWLRETTGVLG